MERGHDMVYVCYDNEAYMNTGIQRASSPNMPRPPLLPWANAALVGPVPQDLAAVIAAHDIPYVAQTTFIGNFKETCMRGLQGHPHPWCGFPERHGSLPQRLEIPL